MPSDQWYEFLFVAGMLGLAVACAVWLIVRELNA